MCRAALQMGVGRGAWGVGCGTRGGVCVCGFGFSYYIHVDA